jgi:hypothetical protein
MTIDENEDENEEPGVGQWTEYTTDRDRVKSIVLTDGEPRSARGIAEAAVVASGPTREILANLVEDGVVTKAERNGKTRYAADRDHMHRESIRMLNDATDREELLELQNDMIERLQGCEEPAHERLIAHRLKIVAEALCLPDE